MKGYKGFDKDLKCRNFQYEVGKTFECNGKIECCKNGFHFCKNPLDVFGYYPPSNSRYCSVEGEGNISTNDYNSKVSVSKLRITSEIGLKGIIDAGVKFIFDRIKWEKNKSNTGYQSAASVEGKDSIAIVTGFRSKAKGTLGCWIVLTNRGEWNG